MSRRRRVHVMVHHFHLKTMDSREAHEHDGSLGVPPSTNLDIRTARTVLIVILSSPRYPTPRRKSHDEKTKGPYQDPIDSMTKGMNTNEFDFWGTTTT